MIDIGTLKNDKERVAFLEDYRNEKNGWYVWKEIEDIGRRWWRFDLDDFALIVEEQLRTTTYPKKSVTWFVMHWYIVHDWHMPFADSVASRTMALAEIKKAAKA